MTDVENEVTDSPYIMELRGMSPGVLRQRRNLMASCLIISCMLLFNINFGKVSFFGTEVRGLSSVSLLVILCIVATYFFLRFMSYIRDEGVITTIDEKYLAQIDLNSIIKIKKIIDKHYKKTRSEHESRDPIDDQFIFFVKDATPVDLVDHVLASTDISEMSIYEDEEAKAIKYSKLLNIGVFKKGKSLAVSDKALHEKELKLVSKESVAFEKIRKLLERRIFDERTPTKNDEEQSALLKGIDPYPSNKRPNAENDIFFGTEFTFEDRDPHDVIKQIVNEIVRNSKRVADGNFADIEIYGEKISIDEIRSEIKNAKAFVDSEHTKEQEQQQGEIDKTKVYLPKWFFFPNQAMAKIHVALNTKGYMDYILPIWFFRFTAAVVLIRLAIFLIMPDISN